LRPSLSPKWPKTMPPRGRATYPAAKIVKDKNRPSPGSRSTKKTLLKTIDAAVAKRMKSENSIIEPKKLDARILRIIEVLSDSEISSDEISDECFVVVIRHLP